jgi:lipopolysaccharide transport system permease protein
MLAATLVLAAIYGVLPIQALLLPLMVVWMLILVGSTTLLVASVAVSVRDIVAVIPLIIQGGLFVTPVAYPIEGAPPHIQVLLELNPLTGIIEAWRWCLLGMPVQAHVLAIGAAWTVVLAVVGWWVFVRLEVFFSDVV